MTPFFLSVICESQSWLERCRNNIYIYIHILEDIVKHKQHAIPDYNNRVLYPCNGHQAYNWGFFL